MCQCFTLMYDVMTEAEVTVCVVLVQMNNTYDLLTVTYINNF